MRRLSLALVDDHHLVAAGLAAILSEEFEIRAVLQSAEGIVGELMRGRPDGLLLDVSLPGLSGIEAVRQIRRRKLPTRILMVSMHTDPAYASEALSAGASGFVLKTAAVEDLIFAVRRILAGGIYVTPSIASAVEELRVQEAKFDPLAKLTRRQRAVLQLAAEGRSAQEIASILGISARTAEFHKYRAKDVLGLKSKRELIQFALQHRLLHPAATAGAISAPSTGGATGEGLGKG
jgi:DNA-binding NarL/FixJ family response regulator